MPIKLDKFRKLEEVQIRKTRMADAASELKYIPFESFEIGQKQNFGAHEVSL